MAPREKTSEFPHSCDIICELSVRSSCPIDTSHCRYHHSRLPYQWQVKFEHDKWFDIPHVLSQHIEYSFCMPSSDACAVQFHHVGHLVTMQIEFDSMSAVYTVDDASNSKQYNAVVRRMSTCSYAEDSELVSAGGGKMEKFVTQWRWFWCSGGSWRQFGEASPVPSQYTLESKFLSGQPFYRFQLASEGVFMIALQSGNFRLFSFLDGSMWRIRRRPLLPFNQPPPSPAIKPLPFESSIPDNWYPVDRDNDYELVPLDPNKLEYHLVASAFHETLTFSDVKINDVFRIQNAFLWHKYFSKRQQIELRNKQSGSSEIIERQLFHGTRDEQVVQAIFRQNFDWRISGTANDTVYGHGAYFARHAHFSEKYAACASQQRHSWMFLARVLVGRTTVGKRDYVRPPPINPSQPHGDLYDSCVNSLDRPTIFVVFDTDQCYPEYVIAYGRI